MMFGSGTLAPAQYDALLLDPAGGELARTTFWVVEPGALPVLSVETTSVAAGRPISVRWENAPAYKWDWLGVYAAGDPDLNNYLAFQYTGATVAGSAAIDESWFGAPLPPGSYEVRLMRDDGYVALAVATFDVARP
jgi:hypothetical protein